MVEDYVPDYCLKATLILGCGNILLGDDGFGPGVIQALREHYAIPADVALVDAGTGVGEILFDVALSPMKPERIILVDILDSGLPTGTLSVLPLESLPRTERKFASLHQEPTSSLLRELEALGVGVTLILVQPELIPDQVTVGLSSPLQKTITQVCNIITERFFNNQK